MASILSAGTTSGTALNFSGDTSGVLQLATNGTTTALSISTAQVVTLTNALPVTSGGTGVTTSTGTGANVLGTSPTITTPTISSLSSASATALTLQSAGTTAVTIDTSQKVGIGTASPNAKLDVSAGQILAGATGNNAIAINSSGANYGFISNPSSGVFALGYGATIGTLGTSVATWNSSGNFAFNSGYGSVATAYGCRVWLQFNGTGTISITGSGNVSSLTDYGTGDYGVTFTTAMPDTTYCLVGASIKAGGSPSAVNSGVVSMGESVATTGCGITVISASSGAIDRAAVFVAVFR